MVFFKWYHLVFISGILSCDILQVVYFLYSPTSDIYFIPCQSILFKPSSLRYPKFMIYLFHVVSLRYVHFMIYLFKWYLSKSYLSKWYQVSTSGINYYLVSSLLSSLVDACFLQVVSTCGFTRVLFTSDIYMFYQQVVSSSEREKVEVILSVGWIKFQKMTKREIIG